MSDINTARALLSDGLQQLHLTLPSSQQQQLLDYLQLLQKWNRVYNLTAIRQLNDMVSKHLLDSLAIAPYLQGDEIIDVGSGAGLPGIPLALYYPEKQFVLIDSNSKKTHFLLQAKQTLKLANIDVVNKRVEAFIPPPCFSSVISRALGDLAKVLQTTQHLCCHKGCLLVMKGRYPKTELAAIKDKVAQVSVQQLQIPNIHAERNLVKIINI